MKSEILKKSFALASSPKLTVGLLAYSVLLVFVATIAQTSVGIEVAKSEFIESFVAFLSIGIMEIPIPGGAAVGIVAFVNIIASGVRFIGFDTKGFGVSITHMALALLLLSGGLQYFMRDEGRMALRIGETSDIVVMSASQDSTRTHKLPFKVHLKSFKEEKWQGSNIPKSYKSVLVFEKGSEKIEAVVEMNAPAAFGGWMFYQMSFGEGGNVSVLGAVRNPARFLPWLAVGATFVGMLIIFIPRALQSGSVGSRK